jgi:SAM-dependent methyltransferase
VPDRWRDSDAPRGARYDERFARLEAAGVDVHGEAALVDAYDPSSVLDAGCGTGRVALELDRRGRTVVGLDLDPAMLDAARANGPALRWVEGDLADPTLELGRTFDLVVMAGNVLIFVEPGSEGRVLANAARWLEPGGRLVAGYALQPGGFGADEHDRLAAAAGLHLEDRWSAWDRVPFTKDARYVVSVHRKAV